LCCVWWARDIISHRQASDASGSKPEDSAAKQGRENAKEGLPPGVGSDLDLPNDLDVDAVPSRIVRTA
jgi:hypothetical protein